MKRKNISEAGIRSFQSKKGKILKYGAAATVGAVGAVATGGLSAAMVGAGVGGGSIAMGKYRAATDPCFQKCYRGVDKSQTKIDGKICEIECQIHATEVIARDISNSKNQCRNSISPSICEEKVDKKVEVWEKKKDALEKRMRELQQRRSEILRKKNQMGENFNFLNPEINLNNNEFIFERENQSSRFGFVFISLKNSSNIFLKFSESLIDRNDLFEREGGLIRKTHHITLLYGVLNKDPDDIFPCLKDINSFSVELGEISVFENKEFDVLIIKVNSPVLKKLNFLLYNDTKSVRFHEYDPHITLAYLKKGTGKKYIEILKKKNKLDIFKNKKISVREILFRNKYSNIYRMNLKNKEKVIGENLNSAISLPGVEDKDYLRRQKVSLALSYAPLEREPENIFPHEKYKSPYYDKLLTRNRYANTYLKNIENKGEIDENFNAAAGLPGIENPHISITRRTKMSKKIKLKNKEKLSELFECMESGGDNCFEEEINDNGNPEVIGLNGDYGDDSIHNDREQMFYPGRDNDDWRENIEIIVQDTNKEEEEEEYPEIYDEDEEEENYLEEPEEEKIFSGSEEIPVDSGNIDGEYEVKKRLFAGHLLKHILHDYNEDMNNTSESINSKIKKLDININEIKKVIKSRN